MNDDTLNYNIETLLKIINTIDELVFVLDFEGKICDLNAAVTGTYGYTKEELLGRNIRNLIHPDSHKTFKEFIESFKKDGDFYRTIECTRNDGSHFKSVIRGSPVEIDAARFVLLFIRAISDEQTLPSRLLQSDKLEILSTLAGKIAHDFNNILGGITGGISMLQKKLNNENLREREKIDKYIDIVRSASGRATDLVRQLLILSRKSDLRLKSVDLNVLLENVLKICSKTFPGSVSLEFHADENSPVINGDPVEIQQAILNICINASHAMTLMRSDEMKEGGRLVITLNRIISDSRFIENHPDAEHGRGYITLTISDNGVGMNRNVKERIFDPFFTTKSKSQGVGLGLSQVYSIVKKHRGMITVDSVEGAGSTFTLFFPEIAEAQTEVGKGPQNNDSIKSGGNPNVSI